MTIAHSRFIALFGPPGSGKSTLVQMAHEMSIPSVDLELFPGTKADRVHYAHQYINSHKGQTLLMGAADLAHDDFPVDTLRILLLPPKDAYMERVKLRNLHEPIKSGQNEEFVYDQFEKGKSLFDLVLTEEMSAKETLDAILQFIQTTL